MPTYRTNAAPIVSPEQVQALLVRPAITGSVIGRVAGLVTASGPAVRFPVVQADPSAGWVDEGAEIPLSDAVFDEVIATPAKLAGLTVASSELLDDSVDGSAATVLGEALARDLSRTLDAAAFTGLAAPAPPGLAQLTGYTPVPAPATWTDFDPFSDAVGLIAAQSATLTAWVTNPADLRALAKIKTGAGSNVSLSVIDGRSETGSSLLGLPVFTTPAVPEGTVWGLDRTRVILVTRQDATIDVDPSVYFTSDRVAVRAKMRAAFALVHPAACAKITRASA